MTRSRSITGNQITKVRRDASLHSDSVRLLYQKHGVKHPGPEKIEMRRFQVSAFKELAGIDWKG